jgi:hypothetical protein
LFSAFRVYVSDFRDSIDEIALADLSVADLASPVENRPERHDIHLGEKLCFVKVVSMHRQAGVGQ